MKRILQPELLDALPPSDPRAMRSRRDLRRVNAWMRNHVLLARELGKSMNGRSSFHVTELGAGDGNFLLSVLAKLHAQQTGNVAKMHPSPTAECSVRLLDRQRVILPETLTQFALLGWLAEVIVADVFDQPSLRCDVMIANLFLHHFDESRLQDLLRIISQNAEFFIAIEPRRAAWPLFCSRLLWAIGCNAVTRHDAVVSVRAGFAGRELSSLWPDVCGWRLDEQPAGPFSHLFVARKRI